MAEQRITMTNPEVGARFSPLGRPMIIAGPCSVESEEQILAAAHGVKAAGATALRGGAFKPRTSPRSFQGLGEEGLRLLALAREQTGLPVVTEVMDTNEIDLVAKYADVLQIGSRNMQNFSLLKQVGRVGKPVMLKRGLSATLSEWLGAAEYITASGNNQVILCERGIRTFETHTRNTLDLSVAVAAQRISGFPVIVDPSHAAGRPELIGPLSKAALAAGVSGLMIEVHPNPPTALSDADQQLTIPAFHAIMADLGLLPAGALESVDGCRAAIDQVDEQILALLLRRADISRQIGSLKQQVGLSLRHTDRETAIVERLCSLASAQVATEDIKSIWDAILGSSRRVQAQSANE